MSVIDAFEYLSLALVFASFFAFARQLYRSGWHLSLAACAAWTVVALSRGMWGLLLQQFVIAGFAFYGLWKLRRKS